MAAPRLVLLAPGGEEPGWRDPFEQLLHSVAGELGSGRVRLAYLEGSVPSLSHVAAEARTDGVRELRVLPLFLTPVPPAVREFPAQASEVEHRHPGVRIVVLPPVGEHPRLVKLLRELALEAAP